MIKILFVCHARAYTHTRIRRACGRFFCLIHIFLWNLWYKRYNSPPALAPQGFNPSLTSGTQVGHKWDMRDKRGLSLSHLSLSLWDTAETRLFPIRSAALPLRFLLPARKLTQDCVDLGPVLPGKAAGVVADGSRFSGWGGWSTPGPRPSAGRSTPRPA